LSNNHSVCRGIAPINAIEIKKTMKKENPPTDGFMLDAHRTCSSVFSFLTPKLKENLKKSQLIRKEIKTAIAKNRDKKKQPIFYVENHAFVKILVIAFCISDCFFFSDPP
jgi:hypothetical protein